MSDPRVSSAQRVKVSSRAETEILRYKDNHALWHMHVHGTELDGMQLLRMMEMDQYPRTIDVSCRQGGRKTSTKELYALKYLATQPYQAEGIVAPRQQQSLTNLGRHLDAIARSPMLKAYIRWKNGREQLTDTRYQFANLSWAQAYGIMSQIDGDSLTFASLEEIDDMPKDRLMSRFLPMLSATQRLGIPRALVKDPQVRVSGVFKGADTAQELIDTGEYHGLPIVNSYLALELKTIHEAYLASMRSQMTEAEFIRQYLCRNVSAQNWIWERHIRAALHVGLKAALERAGPAPGRKYKKRGLLSFGYDHLGHGESDTASKSALVVAEQIGGFTTFPFVYLWAADTDEKVIAADLLRFWEYFGPEYAYGDAYGIGLLTDVNDRLYGRGLTQIDRRTVGEGQSTATTWQEWAFAPIRFEGMTKHSMASALRSIFHNGQAAIPFFDDAGGADEAWIAFVRQLGNIRTEATKASYASFRMASKRIGDDLFDAAMAAVWALVTRGVLDVPAIISHRTQTREQLLGQAPALPGIKAAA